MKPVAPLTRPTVCILELLKFDEELSHKEGEIISRTLRLSEIDTQYVYMRTEKELESLAVSFGK